MSNNKHTKGHWETTRHPLKDGFTAEVRLSDGNKKLIAKVRGDNYANLIAAAPTGLENAKDAVNRLNTGAKYGADMHSSTIVCIQDAIKLLNEFIKKAEGK